MKNGQQKTVLLAEAGSMIVLLAVSITTLMLMIGLAIDAGNIYRARLALQNAADASAMGALNYCSSIGHTDMLRRVGAEGEADENVVAQHFTAHLAPHIARLARLNLGATAQGVEILRAEYLPAGDPEVSSGAAFAIAVSLQQDVDLMLLDLLPQAAFSSQRLVARAVTERRIANVALLIDVSGSMQCPAIGSCDCLPSQGGAGCPAGNTKFDLLLDAVKSFIRMFDDDHDRIVLAPFDLQAQSLALRDFATQLGVESDASTTVIDALVDAIRNEYVPSGSTNICDAFIEAAADLDVLAGDETKSFVLFTEGAPTAGRFFFTDTAAKAALDPFDVGFGRYDYTHYTIDWKQTQLDAATGRPKVFQGPSLLVNSLALTGNSIEELSMPMTNPAAPPRRSTEARCNDDLSAAGAVVSQSDVATVSERVFSPCLSSLEAHAPGNPEVKYGGNYAAGTNSSKGFRDWREAYYHCAIQYADALRSKNGIVYTVGLGEPGVTAADDPYEDINNPYNRKDVLLSRLALDVLAAPRRQVANDQGVREPVEFAYQGYIPFAQSSSTDIEQKAGIYFPTRDASELQVLFQKIAREVLFKLVE